MCGSQISFRRLPSIFQSDRESVAMKLLLGGFSQEVDLNTWFSKLAKRRVIPWLLEEVQCYESVPKCEACRGNTVRLDSTRAACLWPSLIFKKHPTPTIPRKVLNIRRSLCLGLRLVQLCFSHRLPAISMRQNTKLFLGMVNSRPSRLRPLWWGFSAQPLPAQRLGGLGIHSSAALTPHQQWRPDRKMNHPACRGGRAAAQEQSKAR